MPGVGASLRALPAALGLVGATVALEDPGYAEAWTAFATEGVRVAAVPVDGDGLDPALLPRGTAPTYVTPSHQYPLGARMPVTRRVQLLEWARRTGGLVLEDDYDGEFRYDVSPLPALRSLPGRRRARRLHRHGIQAGGTLAAGRLAGAAAPAARPAAGRARVAGPGRQRGRPGWPWPSSSRRAPWPPTTPGSPAPTPRAGPPSSPRWPGTCPARALEGVDAGLHVVLRLPDDVDDLDLVSRLGELGLATSPLSAYAVEATVRGLVLCYAGLPETQADAAVRRLAQGLGTDR